MRSLTIICAATILFAGPAIAQDAPKTALPGVRPAVPQRCNPTAGVVVDRNQKIAPQKLGDLPPATHFYAVYRKVDGCAVPVVLREGVGANPDKRVPPTRVPPSITPAH